MNKIHKAIKVFNTKLFFYTVCETNPNQRRVIRDLWLWEESYYRKLSDYGIIDLSRWHHG